MAAMESVQRGDVGQDHSDHSEDEDVDALHQLPLEERRKALRRLRNRESARRVRARRLTEMSVMEETVTALQEDNASLRTHIVQLQETVQSLTIKVYEVTAKYEAAVQENARLRGDTSLHQTSGHRVSFNGHLPQLQASATSASLPAMPLPAGPSKPDLMVGGSIVAQAPRAEQQKALEEVVWLLQEHKRRSELSKLQDLSGSGSSAHTSHSPTLSESRPVHAAFDNHSDPQAKVQQPGDNGVGGLLQQQQQQQLFLQQVQAQQVKSEPSSSSAQQQLFAQRLQAAQLQQAATLHQQALQIQQQQQALQLQQQQQQRLAGGTNLLGIPMQGGPSSSSFFNSAALLSAQLNRGSQLRQQQQQQQQQQQHAAASSMMGPGASCSFGAATSTASQAFAGVNSHSGQLLEKLVAEAGSNTMVAAAAWSSGCNVAPAAPTMLGLGGLGHMDDLAMDFMEDLVIPQDL